MTQIYDLNTLEQRLDFEAYEDMAYTVPAGFPRLHTFEMEDCVAGLCFCDDDAAQTVAACVAPALPRSGTGWMRCGPKAWWRRASRPAPPLLCSPWISLLL